MDDDKDKLELEEEMPIAQEDKGDEENRNILEELKYIEQEIKTSNYQTFKRNTNWHQENKTMEKAKQEEMWQEMHECLLRIEAKLNHLEKLLEK